MPGEIERLLRETPALGTLSYASHVASPKHWYFRIVDPPDQAA